MHRFLPVLAFFRRAALAGPGAPRDTSVRLGAHPDAGVPGGGPRGHIALVGAGPGARDLLTLRAIERLQAADVVFYDRLVDPQVLELAGPRAERVFVGKQVGAHAWPQDRINAVIVAEAARGRRVVRLKSGDPGIFGRANEEIDAARAKGIPVEIVPGITAASAASASLGRSLTERGVTNTLVLTTGTGRDDDPHPDCTRLAGPGVTTAFYMSVGQAERISRALIAKGLPADTPIDVIVDASKAGERSFAAPVRHLAGHLATQGVRGCAILLLTWPETLCPIRDEAPQAVAEPA